MRGFPEKADGPHKPKRDTSSFAKIQILRSSPEAKNEMYELFVSHTAKLNYSQYAHVLSER